MFADIVGYTSLMARSEDAALRVRERHRQLVRPLVEQHRGEWIEEAGDESLSSFPSALDAVHCALAVQEALRGDPELRLRIGIHLGDVTFEGGRVYGDGVNVAARIRPLAQPGGICVSGEIVGLVRNQPDLKTRSLGERELKNVGRPVEVFALGSESVPIPTATEAPPAAASSERRSIAVLPFTNMSGDAEQEYFSDGITEDLITDLSKVSGLFVIARNSTFTYKGRSVRVDEVGRELGVRYVLEGSVRRAGNRVRITAQLVEAETGHHVWAERYDRELEDVFAVQDEVTSRIVEALEVSLTEGERGRLGRVPTENLAAYDAFLRGGALLRAGDHVAARGHYAEALERDPGFALAATMSSLTYLMEFQAKGARVPALLEQAIELGERGVELDPGQSLTHSWLGMIYGYARRFDDGLREIERALALNPSDAQAHGTLGSIRNHLGQHEQARAALEQALRLDPHGEVITFFHLGIAHTGLGQIEEAQRAFKSSLALAPGFYPARLHLAILHQMRGETEAAREALAEVLRLDPGLSLEQFRRQWPVQDPKQLEPTLELLREIGLS